ncbi:MAG: NAD(P)H-hydrate dehydratase [Acetobacteraceae bacterium]|nr:NAD(P)H-hydrate dehydratase [Acetobacteraceae bacterium]
MGGIVEELLTPDEMARADANAVATGTPVAVLMERAGWAVAQAMRARWRPCPVLVLCGPGNNGGDGYVAARLLDHAGWPVAVAPLAPPRGDAAAAAARWRGRVVEFTTAEAARTALVIDAVFGAGLTRDLDPTVSGVLSAAPRIIAVDVPSGLDGTTGAERGAVAAAALTITFHRRKPGHLLLPGRALCGELVLADIGIPPAIPPVQAWRNTPALWTLPRPTAIDHKYTRGHVTVLGGATMTGAARLAAAAARRVGAGLVTITAPHATAPIYRAGDPGLLVDSTPLAALLGDGRRTVWVCGPGLDLAEARAALPVLLDARRLSVLDAGALTACAGAPGLLRGATVLTPHSGEFARVFGPPGPDRVAAARAAAASTGAVVLLKGADTIIAAPDGRVAINDSAPPWLATAGSGDVLAGAIAGLLAQGMPPWQATCAAVWLHGAAARRAGPGLIAEDLLTTLGQPARGGSMPGPRPVSRHR